MREYTATARALDVRLQNAKAENDRLRAEVERIEGEAEGWARVAGAAALRAYTTGAEVEHLRLGIAELRAGMLRGLAPGDGTEPEPMTEVSSVVACLDALTREGGEGP